MLGSSHNDTLEGSNWHNHVKGGAGDDVLFGRDGNDTIVGQMGGDTLIGGTGADTFMFASASESRTGPHGGDEIVDFEVGIDTIDVSALALDGFGDGANELDFFQFAGNTFLINSDMDFLIMLHGDNMVLSADDFIF